MEGSCDAIPEVPWLVCYRCRLVSGEKSQLKLRGTGAACSWELKTPTADSRGAVTEPLAHWGTSERFTVVGERGQFERLLRTRSALEASGSSNHYGFSWVSPVGGREGLDREMRIEFC